MGFGNGETKETKTPEVEYTYTKAGDFKIVVEAKDKQGAAAKSGEVSVYAGNETPEVSISLPVATSRFICPACRCSMR